MSPVKMKNASLIFTSYLLPLEMQFVFSDRQEYTVRADTGRIRGLKDQSENLFIR
jgi:hypothetical protein